MSGDQGLGAMRSLSERVTDRDADDAGSDRFLISGSIVQAAFHIGLESLPVFVAFLGTGRGIGKALVCFGLSQDHGLFHVDAAEIGQLEDHDLKIAQFEGQFVADVLKVGRLGAR